MSLKSRWVGMRARCRDKNNPHYGGRGIKVCKQWEKFAAFKRWALANGFRDDLTIDRINNDGHYQPSNCRWVTALDNFRNSTNVSLTAQQVAIIRGCLRCGQTKASLSRIYGVSVGTITAIQKWKTWKDVPAAEVDINTIPKRLRYQQFLVRTFNPITGQEEGGTTWERRRKAHEEALALEQARNRDRSAQNCL